MRAVVDTNVWVSALINKAGPPAEVLAAYRTGDFMLVTSEEMLEEVSEVLARPRIARKYGIRAEDIAELLTHFRDRCHLVARAGTTLVCRDPDDNILIKTAAGGGADVLVSRDEDLTRTADVAQHPGLPRPRHINRNYGIITPVIYRIDKFIHID